MSNPASTTPGVGRVLRLPPDLSQGRVSCQTQKHVLAQVIERQAVDRVPVDGDVLLAPTEAVTLARPEILAPSENKQTADVYDPAPEPFLEVGRVALRVNFVEPVHH